MANSNTKASKASRAKCTIEWAKKKKQAGELLIFKVDVTTLDLINQIKALKISKAKFLRNALNFLDEKGEIK